MTSSVGPGGLHSMEPVPPAAAAASAGATGGRHSRNASAEKVKTRGWGGQGARDKDGKSVCCMCTVLILGKKRTPPSQETRDSVVENEVLGE